LIAGNLQFQKYDHLIWMKLGEIARYWSAKELKTISVNQNSISIKAPFATPGFTLKMNSSVSKPGIKNGGGELSL
jgi:hypothetical protein